MAWSRKDARDDLNHPKPVKLPLNGWDKPEQRAVAAAHEALREPQDEAFVGTVHTAHYEIPISLTKFEEAMNEDRIAKIQEIVSKLTYGEMIEMAEMLANAMPQGQVDKDQFKYILPPTLHAFASKREEPVT